MEMQRQQRIDETIQKEIDDANPKLTSKSKDLAAKYRAKQMAELQNQLLDANIQNQSAGQENSDSSIAQNHVLRFAVQKAQSDIVKENAKRQKDLEELQKCTFKPQLNKKPSVSKRPPKTMTLSLVEELPKNNDKVVEDLAAEENKMAGYEAA
jgi:Skp family chaperone for outer membrane proteins